MLLILGIWPCVSKYVTTQPSKRHGTEDEGALTAVASLTELVNSDHGPPKPNWGQVRAVCQLAIAKRAKDNVAPNSMLTG